MKKILTVFFAFALNFIWAQEEQITSFHTEIKVDTSALIQVSEHIDIVSAGKTFKRGIVRYLPMYKKDSAGNRLKMNYKIISVKKENIRAPYHTKKANGNLEIYVGEKDVFIPDGKHQYTITYTAENAIGFFENHDELYWNVNGFGWDFLIPKVSTDIYFPAETQILQQQCYTGSYGSTQKNCTSNTEGSKASFSALNILPNQNLTIAVGIEKGIIHEPPPPPPPTFFERFGLFIIALIFSVFLGLYYIFTWRKHGVDPPKPTVYPQFEAPDSLSPASVGMIHKEHYWQDLITTSIVNLAIKGYIKIKEEKDSYIFGLIKNTQYTLIRLKSSSSKLPKEEQVLLKELFSGRNKVELDGKYKSYVKDAVDDYRKELKKQHNELINEGNNYKFLVIPILSIVIFLLIAAFVGVRTGTDEIFSFIVGGVGFMPFIFIAIFIVKSFKISWGRLILVGILIIIALIIVAALSEMQKGENWNMFGILGFLLYAVITFSLYQYYIKRPSEEKLRKQSLIDGFKMYLNTAEEKQLQHFNPPQVTPEIFEKFLPYAIALGADEVWGKKFQNYLSKSALGDNYKNDWYVGSSFNSMNFGHNLNSNLSNSFSTAASPPSSSGSGSGGGGFSGGGGGGGGGGGW